MSELLLAVSLLAALGTGLAALRQLFVLLVRGRRQPSPPVGATRVERPPRNVFRDNEKVSSRPDDGLKGAPVPANRLERRRLTLGVVEELLRDLGIEHFQTDR